MPDERDMTAPDSPMAQRFVIYVPWGQDGALKALAGDVPLFLYDNQQLQVIPVKCRDLQQLHAVAGAATGLATPEGACAIGPVEGDGPSEPSEQANANGEQQDTEKSVLPPTRKRKRKKKEEATKVQPVGAVTPTDEAAAIEANFDPLDMDELRAEAARLQKVDLDAFVRRHGLVVVEDNREENGGRIVKITCPFHHDHSASFLVSVTGIVTFWCFHRRCQGKGWDDVVSLLEPAQGGS